MLSSRPREARKRGEGKKKRGERGAFFFAFGSDLGILFCLSKLTSACARDEFRSSLKKVFIIIANKTRRNRAHSHSLSLTIFLSSLNNLHSPPQKRNVSSAYFRRCKKNFYLSLREEISLGSTHDRGEVMAFLVIKGLPRGVLHDDEFLYHRRF